MSQDNVEENIAASQAAIRKNAKAARMQARAELRAHLGKLINRADSSDLEFICKEGIRVEACRIFLAGRSPVFDSMLTNGMLESTSSVINLPEVPAPALLALLEFLYTGNILDHRPMDWQMGLEIISAAQFFLLPTVDKIVEEFIMTQIPCKGEDLRRAASMLSVAMTFKCLSHDENTAILQLISLLESKWMHSDYACHLSEEAVDFILRHTKPKLKNKDHLDASLEEYVRFRGVLLWCMYNSRLASVEEVDRLVNEAIPIARGDLYCKGVKDLSSMELVWLPKYNGDCVHGEILHSLKSHGAFESAIRLLTHIDWVRVPPAIFVKIVEPLKLVPESRLLDIFRFHSLHRKIPLILSWAHNRSYSVRDGGLVIQKNGGSPGSAICQLENRAGEDLHIWRYIVRKVDNSLCQVGFVCSEGLEDLCRTWNFEGDCVDALRGSRGMVSRVIKWKTNAAAVYFDGYGSDYRSRDAESCGHSVEKIEFQYYRSRRSCAIAVGDKQLGTVWTGLPSSGVYPAVCLGDNSGASVRLEIVRGFEVV